MDDERLDREERSGMETHGVLLKRKGSRQATIVGRNETIDLNDPAAWPESIREFAFELWMETGRFLAATYTKLREEYRTPVPRHVLEDWRIRYDWNHEADMRIAALFPILSQRTEMNNIVSAEAASRYLIAVNNGAMKADNARTSAARLSLEAAGKNKSYIRTQEVSLNVALRTQPAPTPLSSRERDQIASRIARLGEIDPATEGSHPDDEVEVELARLPDGVTN